MSHDTRTKRILENADEPLSTQEVAKRLGVSWNTAANALNDLYERGEVDRKEISNRLTWWSDDKIQL